MCILSQPIRDIAKTSIFVNDLGRGEHGTVYSMRIETQTPVAMILPVPILVGSGENGLSFVDLSGYPKFFPDMEKNFPELTTFAKSFGGTRGGLRSNLEVQQVGAFKASHVPTMEDFDRLDPIFRLDPTIWASLPDYGDFGFAVFQFDPMSQKQIHPMAYRYPADNPTELFFPTVHVHDGKTADKIGHFDHSLYYQHGSNFTDANGWEKSEHNADSNILTGRTQGLVRPSDPLYRKRLHGNFTNADQILYHNGSFVMHEQRPVRVA